MHILDLPDGKASLEFDAAERAVVRDALVREFGKPDTQWIPDGEVLDFDGDKLIYLDEWDQPCLIAGTDREGAMLRRIKDRVGGGEANLQAAE